jgi:hypothetical protein
MTIRLHMLAFALVACGNETQQLVPQLDAGGGDAQVLACGPGTVDQNGTCVPATRRFELRIAETELGANGHTKRRVLALGTEVDGTPIAERVIVGVDRASAGSFTKTAVDMGTYGATTHFTPCLATSPDCLGPATLTLALASDPSQIVATSPITLVPDTNVSSVAPCQDFDTKIYLDGNDFITTRILEAEEATWEPPTQFSNAFEINVRAPDDHIGFATLRFNTIKIAVPMSPGIFEDARRAAFEPDGHPGLAITANGHACNMLGGRFQVHHYTRDTATTQLDLLISFEQHCEFAPELTEGCLRYRP